MLNIPKTAYFYWGGRILPYLRYMCFKSFKQFNPDWNVVLFTPVSLTEGQTWHTFENKEPLDTEDYSDRLATLDIQVKQFDMEDIGYANNLPEVLKSDLLRLYLLSTAGGLWSDCDILYFKPISNTLKPTNANAYFCFRRGGVTQDDTPKNGPLYHSIGFLMGSSNCGHFKRLLDHAGTVLDGGAYQSVGSPYYKTMIDMNSPDIFNIDMNMVYPSRAPVSMFENPAGHHLYEIRDITCGWHYYGGCPTAGKFQNLITEKTYMNYDNIICHILRKLNNNEQI